MAHCPNCENELKYLLKRNYMYERFYPDMIIAPEPNIDQSDEDDAYFCPHCDYCFDVDMINANNVLKGEI